MIKATFPSGITKLSVNGLHQWDYGQTLQVEASGLPTLVEVHFACEGMTDAVVRYCSVIDNELTAVIPDECLEQTSPVVAWVYCINGTEGATRLTVVMPIIARARPATGPTAPTQIINDYTELLNEINERVELLNIGGVKVTNAEHADTAGRASLSDHAMTASEAQRALSAQTADYATEAGYADNAQYAEISNFSNGAKHADFAGEADRAGILTEGEWKQYTSGQELAPGLYVILDKNSTVLLDTSSEYSAIYYGSTELEAIRLFRLQVDHSGDGPTLRRCVWVTRGTSGYDPSGDNYWSPQSITTDDYVWCRCIAGGVAG